MRTFFSWLAAGMLLTPHAMADEGEQEEFAESAVIVAESQYLETKFDAAEATLQEALDGCGEDGCSDEVLVKMYMLKAAVLANGKKRLEDAKDVFVVALELDETLTLDPDLTSEELRFALDKARKELGLDGDDGSEEPSEDGETPPPEDPDRDDDIRRNWIRVVFITDVSLLIAQPDLCFPEVQEDKSWVCARGDGSRYLGRPALGQRNNLATGIGLSTLRVAAGYDRVLGQNFTVGLRVGFAFLGADEGDAEFLPLHIEARAAWWPGEDPFRDVVRPHFFIGGGLGQVDTTKEVRVVEDAAACGAVAPLDPCSVITDSERDSPEPRTQDLTAFKQAGPGFATGGFGLSFSPTPLLMIDVALRASVTFPVVTPVFSPETGVSFGF